MTLNEIRRLPEFNNHDKICKQIFERIYQSKFPDKPTDGNFTFDLKVNFEGTSLLHLKGEINTNE